MGKTLRDDNIIFRLVTRLDDADKKIDKLDKKSKGLSGTFAGASKNASGLFKAIAGGAAAIALTSITKKAIQLAGAFEQTSVSFKTLTGNIETATKLVGDIEKISVVTPFAPDTLLRAGKTLLAFGVDATRIADTIQNLGEASAATGADMNNLAFIFGQARATGVLFTQDLNQLANAGLPILSLLAEEMGEAEGNIRKLASEGKVTFPILERAFARAARAGGRFSGALKEQSETLEGLKSTRVGVFDQLLRQMGSELLPVAKEVQKILIGVGNALSSWLFPAQKASTQLQKLQADFNAEVSILRSSNLEQSQRSKLIGELNEKYKDYLPNLDAEKASYEDIEVAIRAGNQAFKEKILFTQFEEELAAAAERAAEALERATEAERQRISIRQTAAERGDNITGVTTDAEGVPIIDADAITSPANEAIGALENIREQGLETFGSLGEEQARIKAEFELLAEGLGLVLDNIISKFAGGGNEVKKVVDKTVESIDDQLKGVLDVFKEADRVLAGTPGALSKADNPLIIENELKSTVDQVKDFIVEVTKLKKIIEDLPEDGFKFIEDANDIFGAGRNQSSSPEDNPLLKQIEAFKDLADASEFAGAVVIGVLQAEEDKLNDLIDLQEQRITRATRAAERGNAEQLQLEEERLNKLLEKRQAAARAQQQIDATLIISDQARAVAASVRAIAEGFTGPGGLVTGIATITALVASIGGIILTVNSAFGDLPSFDVGSEYIQKDQVAQVHKGERYLTAQQNAAIGRVPNADVPGYVNMGIAASMDRKYLYSNQRELIDVVREGNMKLENITDAVLGDADRMRSTGGRRRSITDNMLSLIR